MQKKLSVPFNQDILILNTYNKYKDSISEVYFPAHPDIFRKSARSLPCLNREDYTEFLGFLCEALVRKNIHPVLLFNGNNIYNLPTRKEQEEATELFDYLIPKGLYSVVITDPLLVPFLKKFSIKIRASVLMDISEPDHIRQTDKLGIDEICLKNTLCRQMPMLKRIRAMTDKKLSLICNATCAYDCIFYQAHHNIMSNSDISDNNEREKEEIMNTRELFKILEQHRIGDNFLKDPFIRPEDLWYYDDVIDTFKIEGRGLETTRLTEIITSYANRKCKSSLIQIVTPGCVNWLDFTDIKEIPENFVEKVSNCNRDCDNCGYCDNLVTIKKIDSYI